MPQNCLDLASRNPSWQAVMCNRHHQTGDIIASDPHAAELLKAGVGEHER
jgi:hypothetical protein